MTETETMPAQQHIMEMSSQNQPTPPPPTQKQPAVKKPTKVASNAKKTPTTPPPPQTPPPQTSSSTATTKKSQTTAKQPNNQFPAVYTQFLANHYYNKTTNTNPNAHITNTRIGGTDDEGNKITGGNWFIPPEDYRQFLQLYSQHVLEAGKKEYFTETQLNEDSPLLIDLDLRHSYETKSRIYTQNHLQELMQVCFKILYGLYEIDDDEPFRIYVQEKDVVNCVEDKKITKDGLHLVVGMKTTVAVKKLFREELLKELPLVWNKAELGLLNSWEDVVDASVCGGKTNWQLYGSCKPQSEAYKITRIYESVGGSSVGGFKEISPKEYPPLEELVRCVSARNPHNPEFLYTTETAERLLEMEKQENKKFVSLMPPPSSSQYTQNTQQQPMNDFLQDYLMAVKSREELDVLVEQFLVNSGNYEWRELHDYVMILGADYYESGSYVKRFRVGCALRNQSFELCCVWMKLCSQSSSFQWNSSYIMEEIVKKWNGIGTYGNSSGDRLTKRSLMFWAKECDPTKFKEIYDTSVDAMIEQSMNRMDCMQGIKGYSHCDLAKILYEINKHDYVCTSLKNNQWYAFHNHRWNLTENGTDLRKFISNELRDIYSRKEIQIDEAIQTLENEKKEENAMRIKNLTVRKDKVNDIILRLGDTNMKDNIMKEARELFYDAFFHTKLDINKNLICFDNGVVDFEEGVFRRGMPTDYLSMTTRIDYIPIQRSGLPTHYYDTKSKLPAAYVPMCSVENTAGVWKYEAMNEERCLYYPAGMVQFDPEIHQPIIDDIIGNFINRIFVQPELREYMWQHLAGTTTGNVPQTFNMYVGTGANGKSLLTSFMSGILGDYKGDVPLTLITEKRQKIGGLAPEIAELKGKRYAVMQEPSKGDSLNEGIMKQLTSGTDIVEGRGLYNSVPTRFYPQFKLIICSNQLLDIKSQDNGTWRRIRKVEFASRFLEEKDIDPTNPLHFKKLTDAEVEKRMTPLFKQLFMAILIDIAFKRKGMVDSCNVVEEATKSYQDSQDYMRRFIRDCVEIQPKGHLNKTELKNEFSKWYAENIGGKEPKQKDIIQMMTEQYGIYNPRNGWSGIGIVRREDNDEDYDEDDVEDDASK